VNNEVKKKVKFKKGIFQRLFWVISGLFILVLVTYFGIRFMIISKIYGNRNLKASEYIIGEYKEIDGLYKENDLYVFRGNTEVNYLKYNNLMFRVVKIYKDGSMEILMDEGINSLYYNEEYTSYLESDIHKYINDQFLELLDKDDLNKSPICLDEVKDINKITCERIDYSSYGKLLMIGDFVNSMVDGESYLGKEGEYYWLGNVTGDKVWNMDGNNLSQSDVKQGYKIRPVVTLNENVEYLEGTGTKDDPIIVSEMEVGYGSYVLIDQDLYVVIDREKSYVKMMLIENSPLIRDVYSNNLLDNLNDEYYDSLSYKKLLVKYSINTGSYQKSYKDITDKKESVYVGIPTVSDFKFDQSDLDYLLINFFDSENIFYYDQNGLHLNEVGLARKIRPVIMIKKQEISSGSGSLEDPYVVEVK